MSFDSFGLHPDLMRAIADVGYTSPTPIQAQAIPIVIEGRDVMGAAQTGTGKTAAFTLPILQRLMPTANTSASPARHPVRALILAPTRELADQISQNVTLYAKYVPLRSAVVFGGVDMNPQTAALRAGVEILIATPGRLLDHVQQKTVSLSSVSVLVLDEADRMLDMGFLPDLQRIVNLLPGARQSLLFSATFSPEIRKLAKTFLNDNPTVIEVAARNAAAENVSQVVYVVDRPESKRAAVAQLVRSLGLRQVIVFTNTKIGASRLARELQREGIPADAIHGDKSQPERLATLERFKKGEVEVMVATDVAARGLDIAELPAVINYDLPYSPEDYVHRIGRTGRAGASGQAMSLMVPEDQRLLTEIEKMLRRSISRETLRIDRSADRGGQRTSERADGRVATERGSRVAPIAAGQPSRPAKAGPQDPIFSQPYQPKPVAAPAPGDVASPAKPIGSSKAAPAGIRRAPKPVPALLGGKRKASS
ncbi:MAG: DEAD/DEAH box helicase [Burkholderiaceae bacterium]|nr:DEAD/DEAH box helicase [Burkholderiaceae bacterium]